MEVPRKAATQDTEGKQILVFKRHFASPVKVYKHTDTWSPIYGHSRYCVRRVGIDPNHSLV